MKKKTDEYYMKRVLALAEKGRKEVAPNPLVGCLIVKGNRIIGKGYHRFFGGAHAEVYALNDAREKSKNATMYVNLEPCCHIGKTHACTDKIIKAGIKKVVIGMKDPNEFVDGKGIKKLETNGIKVKVGVLKKQTEELNKFYLKRVKTKKPFVILKTAESIDGKIATFQGESRWITGEKSRKYVHRIRSWVDAVLVGINTIIKDNPCLTCRIKGKRKDRPVRIVLDSHLRIPLNANVIDNSVPTIIVTTKYADREKVDLLTRKGIKVLTVKEKEKRIDFKSLIKKLGTLDIFSIMIEGGGEINAAA
ncbi:bifunctional diaminohydroxyphosphoribosylaminopyrimidine deaminase/5-amino-6-(5-phosphoribosylamino)uracil reductase RibD, partial [bacterium]|nr:bifunctional diaminohydroxyphosphoribosylaminopyrimidine deaminase/5-amino-6-(5-phosphoribosylamino)uracil reductase RibD [bacterium]